MHTHLQNSEVGRSSLAKLVLTTVVPEPYNVGGLQVHVLVMERACGT